MIGKTEAKWLEKIWVAEVENRLPFQSSAAIYKRLEAQGLVQRGKEEFRSGGLPITVEGWYLTHAGRFAYCSTCDDERDAAGDSERKP